jgi:hypothetical protein
MIIRPLAFAVASLAIGCSSSSGTSDAPVIDDLEVPATTSTLTLNGQTGPGVILTLTAHDPGAGIDALHVVFTENNVDQPISIPGSPTTISQQQIELVMPGAPSGQHPVTFHLTNVNGESSEVVTKTITVP